MHPGTLVIVNQSTGALTIDVCNAFVGKYKTIYLICGRVSEDSVPLHPSIKVLNIVPYQKGSIFKRIKTWGQGSLQMKRVLKNIEGPKDVLYFTNPPMSYLWADKMDDRFGIVEYDLYPDALSNIHCPKIIINWWANRNKAIFAKSCGIITLSDGMKRQVAQYCSPDIISVIPNWSTFGKPEFVAENENPFIKSLGLEGKFIVMYSGNIGYTHNVETLVGVAHEMKDDPRVVFLIIGEGGKKAALQEMADNLGLKNVIFHTYLPFDEIKYSMNTASLGVVTLTPETANVSVPSKTYNYLGYGLPILNIAPPNTEVGAILDKYECGASYRPDDIKGIAEFIRQCSQDFHYMSNLKTNTLTAGQDFTSANAKEYVKIFD